MQINQIRSQAGVAGPFPVRFPLGFVGAIILGIGLLPMWWELGFTLTPQLKVFYLRTYFATWHDSYEKSPATRPYRVYLHGDKLAVQQTLTDCPECVRIGTIQAAPAAFHEWLKSSIYHGSALTAYYLPVTLGVFGFGGILIAGMLWDRRRRANARKGVHIRGTRMIGWKEFNREVLKDGATPGIRFTIGSQGEYLVIPRELENYHLNLLGATGMGKSTIIRQMLYQIEARGDVAVIYDPKGEFRNEFCREDRDIIFDPTDERCPYFALEEEAPDEATATPWAMAFWPDEPRQQPFFKKHPRAIFSYLISRFSIYNEPQNPASCANLGRWLTQPRTEIANRLRGTEHAIAVDDAAKDQSQGLFTTLGEIAKPLRMMPPTPKGRKRFSVREWSKTRPGHIFMTSTPLTVDAVLPLQSAVMDMLILSNQEPRTEDDKRPHVWFVIDEVPTMQQLPQLESGMTKQRASENPIVLGLHDFPQMKKRYGDDGALTVMGQAFTNIVFRNSTCAKEIENLIAHAEIERAQENRPTDVLLPSNRASSLSSQTADVPVVSAAEIQALPRFHGYLIHEGKVTPIRTQEIPRRKLTDRIERIIPPLIFREPPQEPVAPVNDKDPGPVPADDGTRILVLGMAPTKKEPTKRAGQAARNLLLRKKLEAKNAEYRDEQRGATGEAYSGTLFDASQDNA